MSKLIITDIDENGNVTTDFSGFIGDACLAEEQHLRRQLAECGMLVTPSGPGERKQGDGVFVNQRVQSGSR